MKPTPEELQLKFEKKAIELIRQGIYFPLATLSNGAYINPQTQAAWVGFQMAHNVFKKAKTKT